MTPSFPCLGGTILHLTEFDEISTSTRYSVFSCQEILTSLPVLFCGQNRVLRPYKIPPKRVSTRSFFVYQTLEDVSPSQSCIVPLFRPSCRVLKLFLKLLDFVMRYTVLVQPCDRRRFHRTRFSIHNYSTEAGGNSPEARAAKTPNDAFP